MAEIRCPKVAGSCFSIPSGSDARRTWRSQITPNLHEHLLRELLSGHNFDSIWSSQIWPNLFRAGKRLQELVELGRNLAQTHGSCGNVSTMATSKTCGEATFRLTCGNFVLSAIVGLSKAAGIASLPSKWDGAMDGGANRGLQHKTLL